MGRQMVPEYISTTGNTNGTMLLLGIVNAIGKSCLDLAGVYSRQA